MTTMTAMNTMNVIGEPIQETSNSQILSIDINELSESNRKYLMDDHMIENNNITICLPFPPVIEPRDLIINKKSPQENPNGKQSRAPNAFIIYRKAFVKAARDQGYILPMTVISSMASASWEKESSLVKEEYKRIAKDAHKLVKEMFPRKPNQRKRKEKWNLVSFQDKSSDDNNKSKSSEKNSFGKDQEDLTISTQESMTINDNTMLNTPLSFTTATSSPNLSEFDGDMLEQGLPFQQSELQIPDNYFIEELNNACLPSSFQDYLNSYLPEEDFLVTLGELLGNTPMDDFKVNNSPSSLNMTFAEAINFDFNL